MTPERYILAHKVIYPNGNIGCEKSKSCDGIWGDVRVAAPEQTDGHEDGQQVHEGCVKLEVGLGRADVVAGRHHPNHDQGQAHRVEQLVATGCP